MKLLGWMHRKLMHDSTEPTKSYTIGNHPACFPIQADQEYYYIDPPRTPSHPITKQGRSSRTSRVEEESFDDPFDFLSIGTFGIELLNSTTDPPTPTLPMSSAETLTDQQPTEITENDLSLMNYELEKFLEAEEAETGNDSSGRSNQGDVQMVACPLRNYLFAASVGQSEANKTRTSLEELFRRNNVGAVVGGDDDPPFVKNCEEATKQGGKGNVAHVMKKVAKRFHPTSGSYTAVSNPVRKKLVESLDKMFHKKVYPEETTGKRRFKVSKRTKKKKNISNHPAGSNKSDQPAGRKSKAKSMKLFCTRICRANGGASPVNTVGHWIKTDSDYVVLEL